MPSRGLLYSAAFRPREDIFGQMELTFYDLACRSNESRSCYSSRIALPLQFHLHFDPSRWVQDDKCVAAGQSGQLASNRPR
ncbi:hypothetical protein C265_27324 [Cupriavidus sp. GA3-3]|nr:hypothetical protein C265_27324 [Cupriavidus sp. GA3-3]